MTADPVVARPRLSVSSRRPGRRSPMETNAVIASGGRRFPESAKGPAALLPKADGERGAAGFPRRPFQGPRRRDRQSVAAVSCRYVGSGETSSGQFSIAEAP